MKKHTHKAFPLLFFCFGMLFIYGCVANKDTALDRRFQNLTARYNYIYNSNVLLTEYNESLLQTHADNYEQILSVYLDPEPQVNLVLTPGVANKSLDDVITKGQTIINEKSFSNYIDDSYMLLGKANYLKGNYFIASEYFDYTAKTYKEDLKTFVMAMNWKARSQMQLNNSVLADKIIDTMLRAADDLKKDIAAPLATTAQMRIYQKRNKEAILLLENAIRLADEKQLRIRWQYILAQLQENENDLQNAFINYTKVENSNAPFEMYFHANLQRIKLRALISGYKVDEEKALLALLKDDKNFDYIDQIYYQVGELFSKEGNFNKAEENYQKSVQNSTQNETQKALSYLKIGDLNFNEFKNYIKAKLYYDSAVSILPKNFRDYDNIVKKAENLQYLTDRFIIITDQDTAQLIAKLPEAEREERIKAYLTPKVEATPTTPINNQSIIDPGFPGQSLNAPKTGSGNTFYFNNSAAISNGISDFKKRWGNRQLEDNWRQSQRSSAQETNQILAGGNVATAIVPANAPDFQSSSDQTALVKQYLDALPTTPALLAASDQKIIDAYFEIASFYQQELNDKTEANKIYLELLRRYPNNNHLVAIYYSLYLNFKDVDQNKSNEYRQLVLTKYPESDFAKTILDPSYSVKKNQKENTINDNYNLVFDIYTKKDYPNVIKQVNDNIDAFPSNSLAPQYAYLRAIAVGRTSKVDALITEFTKITTFYPDDLIITPLVRDHLKYIEANLDEFKQRPVALIDFDPNASRFMAQENTTSAPAKPLKPESNLVVKVDQPAKTVEKPSEIKPQDTGKPSSIFSASKSEEYYYVIDVADVTLTLSSSRFGIGQFNRGNYPDNDLAHKLVELDNDQLIYVTSFIDLEDAKIYESSITGQLKNIMKVPSNLYKGFIISKENFEKLTSRARIDEYLEFLKDNYK